MNGIEKNGRRAMGWDKIERNGILDMMVRIERDVI